MSRKGDCWDHAVAESFFSSIKSELVDDANYDSHAAAIGWHVLRHTFGSHLAQRGASPKAIQELMGHSDIATTMRYMHLAPAHHREAISLLEAATPLRSVGTTS